MSLIFLPRILSSDAIRTSYVLSKTPKFLKNQSAFMTSKEHRDPTIKKPAPWPYETKKFTFNRGFFEGTVKRFDENTKIIIVDGNIGAGKSSFAKQLADAFDLKYFPEPSMDRYFVSAYGFDLRKIDSLLPPSFKCCDIDTYYSNPHHQNVAKFQMLMYMFRLEDYLNALAHVLNTGQGVVMERSVYGDTVFMQTMLKFGYLSQRVMDYFTDSRKNTLEELLRPHLIVYLDITPEVALERIKKRNNPVEVNSKVLTKEYLATIEHFYKQDYLKKMEEHAEILVYDWNNYGDVEVVVEDIERIDFDKYCRYDKKMRDWMKEDDWEWNESRRWFTNYKERIMDYGNIFRPSVSELYHTGEDVEKFNEILNKVPGERYAPGFNTDAGDSPWFKTESNHFKLIYMRRHPGL